MEFYEILYNTDQINLVLYITSYTQKYNDRPPIIGMNNKNHDHSGLNDMTIQEMSRMQES